MRKRNNLQGFEGGFIPKVDTTICSKTNQGTDTWQGESDREENLSDPKWH